MNGALSTTNSEAHETVTNLAFSQPTAPYRTVKDAYPRDGEIALWFDECGDFVNVRTIPSGFETTEAMIDAVLRCPACEHRADYDASRDRLRALVDAFLRGS